LPSRNGTVSFNGGGGSTYNIGDIVIDGDTTLDISASAAVNLTSDSVTVNGTFKVGSFNTGNLRSSTIGVLTGNGAIERIANGVSPVVLNVESGNFTGSITHGGNQPTSPFTINKTGSGDLTLGSPIVVGVTGNTTSTLNINNNGGTLTISGNMTNNGTSNTINVTANAGLLALSGTNNFWGKTTVTGGELII